MIFNPKMCEFPCTTNKKSPNIIHNYYGVGHHKHPYELLFITPSHINIFKSPSELNSVNKRIFAIHVVTIG